MFLNGRILIFARTPEPGAVKTRLQPVLGEEGCCRLHQRLVQNAIGLAVDSNVAPVEVWHTGNPEHAFWQKCSDQFQIVLREQSGSDLGSRMHDAAVRTLADNPDSRADWLILIGSDCPEIDGEYLAQAAQLLESGTDVVLGPALDGGYVLIGLRQPKAFLFNAVPWGTGAVLEKTIANAHANNCAISSLKPLRDLDELEDLRFFQDQLTWISSVSFDEIH